MFACLERRNLLEIFFRLDYCGLERRRLPIYLFTEDDFSVLEVHHFSLREIMDI